MFTGPGRTRTCSESESMCADSTGGAGPKTALRSAQRTRRPATGVTLKDPCILALTWYLYRYFGAIWVHGPLRHPKELEEHKIIC